MAKGYNAQAVAVTHMLEAVKALKKAKVSDELIEMVIEEKIQELQPEYKIKFIKERAKEDSAYFEKVLNTFIDQQ